MNEFLSQNFPDQSALLFSKRFWSAGNNFKPDSKSGKVDMSADQNETRPTGCEPYGCTNFDYGLYDEATGKWWHANHCDMATTGNPNCGGPMEVYESTLKHYSRPLADFDTQVFCVGVAKPVM